MVLLTDSAVDQSLIQQGGADVEGVNAIYPWPASDFAKGNEGFKTIGRDARNVVERLLEDVSKQYSTLRKERAWFTHWIRSTLRIHKTSDARDTAVAVVEQLFQTKKAYPLSTGGRIAKFNAEIRNEQAKFHIWKIQDGKFIDID
jgi:branched-chain amino acid transport system substrate-binding protein